MMNYFVNGLRIRKMGYYVPGLSTTFISIKQHMKYDGCFFHAENNEAVLAYPAAIVSVKCDPEMYVNISSAVTSNKPYTFDETQVKEENSLSLTPSQSNIYPKTNCTPSPMPSESRNLPKKQSSHLVQHQVLQDLMSILQNKRQLLLIHNYAYTQD